MAAKEEADVPIGDNSYSRRKRTPGRLFTRRSDVYVSRNSDYKMQLGRCEGMLEKEFNEITIHGLGAAVNRAIHLALSLEERSLGRLKVSANTSTVEMVDDLEPSSDDAHPYSEVRHNSAIHIRVYKPHSEATEAQTAAAVDITSTEVEEKEGSSSPGGSHASVVSSAVSPVAKSGPHPSKRKRRKRLKSTEST